MQLQDFLQWSSLSRIVLDQILTQPRMLVDMTLFMRSPQAGTMFASNFVLLFIYDLLCKMTRLGSSFHEAILPPKLLYQWRRLVSQNLSFFGRHLSSEMHETWLCDCAGHW